MEEFAVAGLRRAPVQSDFLKRSVVSRSTWEKLKVNSRAHATSSRSRFETEHEPRNVLRRRSNEADIQSASNSMRGGRTGPSCRCLRTYSGWVRIFDPCSDDAGGLCSLDGRSGQ